MIFSVIVPVFNTGRYIDRCMAALLEQDYPNGDYEIIAIDNGSTDDSLERLSRYPVTIVQEAKRGSYAARNAGLRKASGKLLAFTDSDCAPSTGWLRAIESSLAEPGCKVIQGKRKLAARSSVMGAINEYEIVKDAFTLGGENPLKYYGYTNNMGTHRETFDRYGPFVERDRGADTIFVRSVVEGESSKAVRFSPDMVIDHLEMNRYRDYLEKMFIYGRSRKRYQHIKLTEPLDFSDRLRIFRKTVRSSGNSPVLTASLISALALGMASWQLGSVAGSIESMVRSEH